MTNQSVSGSCLCGDIRFQLSTPVIFFQYCHCSRCRKTTGSAHAANLLVPASQFIWLRGGERVHRFELEDAQHFCSGFCPRCGSNMPWRTRNEKAYLVPAGTLDEDPGVRPERNIHLASKAPWYRASSELPMFDEVPPAAT